MAGFQKYPYPRYLNGHFWVINKNWRRNMFHIFVPLCLLNFALMRHWSISAYQSVRRGEYVDPGSNDAPKKMKLLH